LGTPVGSVLIGTKELVKKARRIRKIFGGGMRQAGFMAAAGIYALEIMWQDWQMIINMRNR
jgi:threonine aldolase